MRIQADFSAVEASTGSRPTLPAGAYIVRLAKPEGKKTKDGQKDQVIISMVTVDNQEEATNGVELRDYITMQDNKGEINKFALGTIKAYAVAALGEDEANNPAGIDTDMFEGALVQVVVTVEPYEKVLADGTKQVKQSNKIERVLPA